MAPKKSLLEDPPAASSSEDEEVEEEVEDEEEEDEGEEQEEEHEGDEDDEEEEEDEDEEEEHEVNTAKPNSSSAVKKPKSDPTPNSDDDDDEEEESEESDSEPSTQKVKSLGPSRGSNPSGKPIAPKAKKPVSKPSIASPTKPIVSAKRPLELEKDSKRKKKKVEDGDEEDIEESEKKSSDGPKNIFARLWSEEDEIVILRGMIDSTKNGVDPLGDLNEFLDSIKKSLHCEVNKDQLLNKIRRLKRKYLNNFKRGKGGEDPVFSKPHEIISYELMKEIWGGKEGNIRGSETSNGNDSALTNGKRSRSRKSKSAVSASIPKMVALSDISMKESPKLEERNGGSMYPCVYESVQSRNNMNVVGENFLKEGLSLIGDSKKKELEHKWKKLHAAELELYLERVELVREQTASILGAFKSSASSEKE